MDEQRRSHHDDERPDPDTEGVRIIGAEEAAEAVERGEVAPRRSADEPRFGDRPPEPAPDTARPALRFPLADAGDPGEIDRPPVMSVEPPRRAAASGAEEPEGTARLEPDAPDAPSGQVELPHWTEPPTGQVPSLLGGEERSGPAEEPEDWYGTAGSSPRWRDDVASWPDDDLSFVAEDRPRIGALDDSERPSEREYLSFEDIDDLDEQVAPGRSVFPDADEDDFGGHLDDALDAPARAGGGRAAALGAADEPYFGWAEPAEADRDALPGAAVGQQSAPREPRHRSPRRRRAPAPAQRLGPPLSGERDLAKAIPVGLALVGVALLAFAVSPAAAMVLVTVVVGVAAAELFHTMRSAGFQPVTLAGLAGTVGLMVGAYNYGAAAVPVVLFLTTAVCLLWYLVGASNHSPVMNVGVTLGGVLWLGLPGAFAGLTLGLGDAGLGILLAAGLGAAAYDVGGFVTGRSAGRQPLSQASPGKTVEGLLGGCAAAFVVVVVGTVVVGWGPIDTLAEGAIVGLTVGLAAPLGDLCESLVKRDLAVKDMGALLPGHGGMLDRFDSALFVVPAVYLLASVSNFFV